MSDPRFAALDVGASYLKAAVLHPATGLVERVVREAAPPFRSGLPNGHRQFDGEQLVARARALLEQVASGEPPLHGVLLSGQMGGVVLLDDTGATLGDVISWQDARSDVHFANLRARVGDAAFAACGRELRPGVAAATLASLALAGELVPGATAVGIPDFAAARLTGAPVVTHSTKASSHGVWDVASGRWHAGAIAALGLSDVHWPTVVGDLHVIGTMSLGGHGVPVHVPIGDQQAAILGALVDETELSLNIATGSQVSRVVDRFEPGDWQTRPFVAGRLLRTITHIPAGRALNALAALLCEAAHAWGVNADPWPWLEAEATAAGCSTIAVDLSFFSSYGGETGSISDMRENAMTAGAIWRAAYDSMARNYARAAKLLGGTPVCIAYSGGLALRSALLIERVSAALALPSRRSPSDEDALHGLLALSMVAAGEALDAWDARGRLAARLLRV